VAELVVDRAYFIWGGEDLELFPVDVPPRFVELTGTRTLIGRRSRSRGISPEIDLSVAPEDRRVSRAHALLDHPADGSLSVTDVGSTNGTWVGDDMTPLIQGVAVPLGDGASIFVGAWTRITFRTHA
jgi:pSer/pThr/pTyr-binding forkhead associated (FHA) protein